MEAVGAGWRIYGVGLVYRVNAKARACLHCPSSPSFCLSISLFLFRAISFLSMASLFVCTPCTLSDASYSADQRDFCLKHDLSLKYLKPDYLWVCHLGRRDVTPAGQWQDPPLLSPLFLPFFAKSDALMQVKSHAFEFPLRTWNAPSPSLSLSILPPSVLFHRRRAPYDSPSSAMKFDTFPL